MCLKLNTLFITSVLLSACSPPPRVAVDERITVSRAVEIDQIGGALIRYAQPGDTLHGIAFLAALNVNDIAAWNNIGDTTKLQVGQRIRLTKPVGFVDKPVEPEVAEVVTSKSTQSSAPVTQEKVTQETVARQSAVASTTWNWPVQGDLLRPFSQANGQQGIDIAAKLGDSVAATNAGEVVYVGNSLKGYGNLVIVKHDETYLSAYAHNSEIFVREGEQVTAQQRIASVGINRHSEAALHFQIRKDGQPVNPLLFLSKTG